MIGTLHIQGSLDVLAQIAAELATKYPDGVTTVVDIPEANGWTADRAKLLVERLAKRQRSLLHLLAADGGDVADDVLRDKLGNESGSLTGLTGPVKKHLKNLQAEAAVPADAAQPWVTLYDLTNPSYQRTRGIRMPSALVPIFRQALDL